jgi:hypothetical protein
MRQEIIAFVKSDATPVQEPCDARLRELQRLAVRDVTPAAIALICKEFKNKRLALSVRVVTPRGNGVEYPWSQS